MAAEEFPAPRPPGTRPPTDGGRPGEVPRAALRRPPLWVRVALVLLGWTLILIGIAGLVLPGLQGVLTILAGLALLSVASNRVHRWLQRLLQRWPGLRRRLDRFRRRLHRRLSRK